LTSTSCEDLARHVLSECLAGRVPSALPRELVEEPCAAALFGILVEGLSDRFEPALCDAYAQLFAPLFGADLARYRRVRQVRSVTADASRVVVLSRITLGADVAVTSVLLDAAKRRFPCAEIVFAGPAKNYELFAGDPRIRHAAVDYRRGGPLAAAESLRLLVDDALVIDPDSRLTQLGLLPICAEDRYCFFESRAYGWQTTRTLPELAADWAAETLRVSGAKPFVALADAPSPGEYVAVSLGVGGNQAKRVPDPFEVKLLHRLSELGLSVWVDKGAGGEEADRVERAAAGARLWEGSFAGFARIIAGARLYVGYDSAGQHVAAACGIPLITVFAGFPTQRMFERWRPGGAQTTVIRVDHRDPDAVLAQVDAALQGDAAPQH
jgi:ADP-heptose:LPS heptosyltransferase